MKVRQQELIPFVLFKEFVSNETKGSVKVEGENKRGGICLVLTVVQFGVPWEGGLKCFADTW